MILQGRIPPYLRPERRRGQVRPQQDTAAQLLSPQLKTNMIYWFNILVCYI
jgi:hypothetical protein